MRRWRQLHSIDQTRRGRPGARESLRADSSNVRKGQRPKPTGEQYVCRRNKGTSCSCRNSVSLTGLQEQGGPTNTLFAALPKRRFCSVTSSSSEDDSQSGDDRETSYSPTAQRSRKRKRTPLLEPYTQGHGIENAWHPSKRPKPYHRATGKRPQRAVPVSHIGYSRRKNIAEHEGVGQPTLPGSGRLRKPNPTPHRDIEKASSEHESDEIEYEVERIVGARLYRNTLQYRAKWLGYTEDPTWYNASNFKNSPCRLMDFHAANPLQPGPPCRLGVWKGCWVSGKTAAEHKDDDRLESICSLCH